MVIWASHLAAPILKTVAKYAARDVSEIPIVSAKSSDAAGFHTLVSVGTRVFNPSNELGCEILNGCATPDFIL